MRLASVVLALAAAGTPLAAQPVPRDTAVFAGGCFWGIQAVFEHVHGVVRATSGYAGGDARTASYRLVGTGTTGHAESVQVIFDPTVVSYATLLKVFFTVAHDPTELNRQGPDEGTQYRSAVFFADTAQQRIARAMVDSLARAHTWPGPIVTQIVPLRGFYVAEEYHQDYAIRHPLDPYIFINDRPKVAHLRERYPELYRDDPVRFASRS